MFGLPEINFCCYLQGSAFLESIFAAIYNVWRSWNQFLLLFTMLGAPGIRQPLWATGCEAGLISLSSNCYGGYPVMVSGLVVCSLSVRSQKP